MGRRGNKVVLKNQVFIDIYCVFVGCLRCLLIFG